LDSLKAVLKIFFQNIAFANISELVEPIFFGPKWKKSRGKY